MNNEFDSELAKRYWRLAPSGAGKHDTVSLESATAEALRQEWLHAFERRFANYAEEDAFLGAMGKEFSGQRVLSIGSGLGLHEIYYATRSARMTCCDIVPSNLATIARVAAQFNVDVKTFELSQTKALGGPYDVVFIYGSLMTMPEAEQRLLLARAADSLTPDGRIILMLYTWEFARDTCGWTSPDQFDPVVFARASDESVGEEHCPWSDWHDDNKLLALAPREFKIGRKQKWQQDWFVWFELSRAPRSGCFFEERDLIGDVVQTLDLKSFFPAAAKLSHEAEGLHIKTNPLPSAYAALSSSIDHADANAIVADVDLIDGSFSIGILDTQADRFKCSFGVNKLGRHTHAFAISPIASPSKVVLSNFRTSELASDFRIRRLILSRRNSAYREFLRER